MEVNNNPVFKRFELSFFMFGLFAVLSLLGYCFFADEIFMWRLIAFGAAVSFAGFLFYPSLRGVKAGDTVVVAIWKEIETPFMSDSYVDCVPTIAMESGRKNQIIEVRFGEGTRGIAKLLHYGVMSLPEARLLEVEKSIENHSMVT